MSELILVLGGARSGKSAFAEAWATRFERVAYVATGVCTDEEMADRIRRHQCRRPEHWQTVEEPREVSAAVRRAASHVDCIILDCLTVWVANLMLSHEAAALGDDAILDRVRDLCQTVRDVPAQMLAVSNEVGCGIVPDNALSRRFRDLVGWANQSVAREADEVHLVTAGIAQRLK